MRKFVFCGLLLLIWLPPLHGQAFGGEVYHFASASTNLPPGRCTLSSDIPAGARVVVLGAEDGNDYHISAVTDSQGNSYSQALLYKNTRYQSSNISIWSSYLSTALSTGDTVTITWNAPTALYRSYGISIVYLTGTAQSGQPDATAEHNAYMRTRFVSVPGTTVKADTVVVGMLLANEFVWTIRNGTVYDSQHINIYYNFFFKIMTSAGPYDPAGTASRVPATYASVWASFSGSLLPSAIVERCDDRNGGAHLHSPKL